MPAVLLSDKLQNGKQYTFRFQAAQFFVPRAADIASHLSRAYSFLSEVKVTRGLTSSLYAVSFTWQGVPTNAGDVAGNMVQILASDGAFSFMDADTGIRAEPIFGASTGGIGGVSGVLPSATVIVLILAVVIVLAIFAGSFGKGLATRL
jgi:hypothetical protein